MESQSCKEVSLTRIFPHFDFIIEENTACRKWKYDDPKFDCADRTPEDEEKKKGQFPDDPVRIEV